MGKVLVLLPILTMSNPSLHTGLLSYDCPGEKDRVSITHLLSRKRLLELNELCTYNGDAKK